MAVNLICRFCGKEFRVTQDRAETAKHCSQSCQTAEAFHAAVCKCCGKEFKKRKSANNRMLYCSWECFKTSVAKPVKVKAERPRYFKVCEVCGATFRVTATRKDSAKTCSRKCSGEIAIARNKEARVKISCQQCGKEMYLSQGRVERGNGKFCSRKCMFENEAWREDAGAKTRGEKHYKWRGDRVVSSRGYVYKYVTGSTTRSRRTVEHRIIALAALVASNDTHHFLVRDVKGELVFRPEIEVHHIDRDRGNNKLSNLLIVTRYAHKLIHNCGRKPDPWECWPPDPAVW